MIDDSQINIDIEDINGTETIPMQATHHHTVQAPTHHHVVAPSQPQHPPQQAQTLHTERTEHEQKAHQAQSDEHKRGHGLEYAVMCMAILAFILLCVEQVLMFTSLLGHVR